MRWQPTSGTQTMLNGSPMTLMLTRPSGSADYDVITVRAITNAETVQLAKENILTGNGERCHTVL